MITEFKIFEADEILPAVGDWIIDVSDEYGKIIDILYQVDREWVSANDVKSDYIIKISNKLYIIKYDTNFNNKEKRNKIYHKWRSEIKFFGTKEELHMKIETDKYNL